MEDNKKNTPITDEDITKALERCVDDRTDCSECPYLGTEIKEGITCEVKMINAALAVIYNLQAENKKLQALLKALDIKIETAEDNKKNTPITDEDIRKALDCCITKDCDKCPFTVFLCDDRYALIWAQDLIKRQDAELERKVDEQKYHKAILVLQAIAQHRGSHGRGSNEYFDEWTQAQAFITCREAALRCLKSLGEPVTMTNKRNGR